MRDFDNKLKDVTSKKKKELNELSKNVKTISVKGLTKNMINKFGILMTQNIFLSEAFQNYLVFIPAKKYSKYPSGTTLIDSWKSNGTSEENIENITKSDRNFAPAFVDNPVLPDINFNEDCVIKNNISVLKK